MKRVYVILSSLAMLLAGPVYGVTSVTLSPATWSFGTIVQGSTSTPKTFTLKNVATAALTITSITASTNFAQTGGTCPLSPQKLAKNASCTILVVFQPTASGSLSGTLTVTDSATPGTQVSKLSGNAIAAVTVSPTKLTFPATPVGQTSTAMTVTLTNNQSVQLNFTSIATTLNDFAISLNNCLPSVPGLGTCTVAVKFSPAAAGARSGTLKFSDDAPGAQQSVALSGTGKAPTLVSIAVTPLNPSIFVGNTQQFTATGTYSDNSTKDLTSTATWTVTPPSVASISTSGLATALTTGSATVMAAVGAINGSTMLTVSQVFAPTGSLNTARYYHTATMLNTGSVLVVGGIGPIPGGNGTIGELSTCELYNPGTGSWTFTGALHAPRDEATATLLNNGSVLVAGGSGGAGELATAEEYNPNTLLFYTTTNNMHTARYLHTASVLPNGKVLIAGGYGSNTVLNSAELYDPIHGLFSVSTTSLNAARFGATATALPNGLILIAGGSDANGPLASAELYDPVAGTFTLTTNSLNVARSNATATLLNNGQVLIAAGYNYNVTGPLTSAELYDPVAGTFTLTSSENATNYLGTATMLNDGSVLLAGSALNSAGTELYTPGPGIFSPSGQLLTARDLQTATLLPNGTVLIAGGHSSATNTILAAAELYEPPTFIPPSLVSIAVTPASPVINAGSTVQMIATGTFSDSSTQQLSSATWISSNTAAAIMTNDDTNSGVAYGVAAGSTVISACTGTLCGSTPMTVNPKGTK